MSRQRVTVVDADGRRRAAWSDPLETAPAYGFMEPANPPSTIERRTLTPEELEARTRPMAHSSPIARVIVPRPVALPTSEDRPVSESPTDPTIKNLAMLAERAEEAARAAEAKTAADIAWEAAEQALRDAWQAIEIGGPTNGASAPAALTNGAAERMARSRQNGTTAMLAKRAAKAAPKKPGGDRARMESVDERGKRVLAALERHGGNTKDAGDELGMRGNVVARIAVAARARAAASA